ncbi:MAG: hypothetical protein LBD09_01465 [Treponema sp.]|jgi:hypothetical protein|nr:hypothetical protein [Treponema sp.]
MKLGFARKDITPPAGAPLAGYLKDRVSTGVHDKLYVRALVFTGPGYPPSAAGGAGAAGGAASKGGASAPGDVAAAMLQLDLLNLDRLCVEKIRQRAAALGIGRDRLIMFAAHTHSAFGGIFDMNRGINRELRPLLGAPDPALVDLVVSQSAAALEEALKKPVETTVRIRRGILDGLGTNRRDPALPCDRDLLMCEFYRIDRKKILLYKLSCHPTVLNGDNLLISADFPGALASRLEDVPDGYDMAVFVNGAAGDMSTRFTRRESGFAECARYALLISEALAALREGVFLPLEKVFLRYHTIVLRRASPPDPAGAEERLAAAERALEAARESEAADPSAQAARTADMERTADRADRAAPAVSARIRRAESLVEGARIAAARARARKKPKGRGRAEGDEIPVETGILGINGETLVCPPLELFSTLALGLREGRERPADVFGYANDLLGYLPDRAAHEAGDYEALFSEFAPGEGERYIEQLAALL